MKRYSTKLIIVIIFFNSTMLFAQGMSRSTGIGMRLSFWNITKHPTNFRFSEDGYEAALDIGGIGGWFYFFKRVYNNWFLEFDLGFLGSVNAELFENLNSDVNATLILPYLIGVRHNLLSTRLASAIHHIIQKQYIDLDLYLSIPLLVLQIIQDVLFLFYLYLSNQ